MPANAEEIVRNLGPLIRSLGRELVAPIADELLEDMVSEAIGARRGGSATGAIGFGDGLSESAAGIVIGIVLSAMQPEILAGRKEIEKIALNLRSRAGELIAQAKSALAGKASPDEIETAVKSALENLDDNPDGEK